MTAIGLTIAMLAARPYPVLAVVAAYLIGMCVGRTL